MYSLFLIASIIFILLPDWNLYYGHIVDAFGLLSTQFVRLK